MKTIYKLVIQSVLAILAVTAIVACSSSGGSGGGRGGSQFAKHKEFQLKNGLKVLVFKDGSLPYVSMGLLVNVGSSDDPLSKSGLGDLTAALIERGTTKRSANQIADAFGVLGTSFSASISQDYSYFSTSGLSSSQDELTNLFFELMTQPSFSVAEVDRLKSEFIADIKRSYDKPNVVASKIFSDFLFGTHPYGRSVSGNISDLRSVKQKDIIKNYLKFYRPNNATLLLVGDIKDELVNSLETRLAKWAARPIEKEALPKLNPLEGQKILFATRDDLKQSEVRLGHYGIQRQNDDYQTLIVAETILGGGLTSRLMKEIREKRGLTYGISSAFDARKETGPYIISTNTRNEKVGEVVRETINTFKLYYEKGVTKEEVENAKGYLRGAFPRSMETIEQLSRMFMILKFYGVNEKYLFNYIDTLDDISVSDVNKVIKKYYHPDKLQIVIYGPKNVILEQLRPLGTVEVKNYLELL